MSGRKTVKDVSSRVTLGAVVRSRAGKTPARGEPRYWGGDVPWLTAKDLKRHRLESSLERITSVAVGAGAPLAAPNDVLILVRGMTLLKDVPVGLVTRPVSFNQDVRCLHPTRRLDGAYLAYVLAAGREQLRALVTQAGHGTGRLDADALKAWVFHLPPRGVQRWLAKCLEQADEALDRTQALIAAKRVFKRALMNDLLTGRRRFPGFVGQPWDAARLGELFAERNETDVSELPLLAVTADRGIIPRAEVGRKDTSNADKSKYKRVLPGDLAYNTMRMWQGVSALVEIEGIISPAYTVVTPTGRMLGAYARHLFKLARQVHQFLRRSQGLVDDTLSLKYPNFARIEVTFPPSAAEQRAIAATLDKVDVEIVMLIVYRDELSLLKRGLMQRLLSGEIELPKHLTAAEAVTEATNDDS